MAKLLYQGHGSYRFKSDSGVVIYVDPFAGEGYDLSADLILVTHEHRDHNQISLVPQKEECILLRTGNMLSEGKYGVRTIKEIRIEAVPAYNKNHDKEECVGYLISMDGKKIYAAGDTSTTDYMSEVLSKEAVDYAFLPIDGIYNMGVEEAAKCAEIIGAVHTIPIHMMPGELFNQKKAEELGASSRMIVQPGTEISL